SRRPRGRPLPPWREIAEHSTAGAGRWGWSLAMRMLAHLLHRMIRIGTLDVIDAQGARYRFQGAPGPDVAIRFNDSHLPRRLAVNPRLVLGEAHMDGTLTIERGELYDLLDLCALNYAGFAGHPLSRIGNGLGWITRRLRQINPVGRARQNVAHH